MQDTNKKKSAFASMTTIQSLPAYGAELSDRAYSLVLGGMLTWGLVLNAIMVWLFGDAVTAFAAQNPKAIIFGLIGYFVLVFAGNFLICSRSTVKALIGFHLISVPIGLLLCLAVTGIANTYGVYIVFQAVAITAVITLTLMIAASLKPELFLRMGPGLVVALLGALIGSMICCIFFRGMLGMIDYVIIAIMALYIGYDWSRAQAVAHTAPNAIAAASALYLDIVNIFIRVLSILARSRSRD